MAEKKKVIRITTPAGIASYPKVQVPEKWVEGDQKYVSCPTPESQDGASYSTGLVLSAEASADLRAQCDAWAEQALSDAKGDPKKVAAAKAKRKEITLNAPYLTELDKDNNETGNFVFKFKTNACATVNSVKKFFKPSIWSAANPPVEITKDLNMYSGSTIKVNFSPTLYYTAATFTCGVSLRLNGLQVIKLVAGGYRTADSLGFGAEEGADEIQNDAPAAAAASAGVSGAPDFADDGATPASDL